MRVGHSRKFNNRVTCVVINLDRRPDRWRRMRLLCRLHGITPIRFSAHDRERGRTTFPDSTLGPAELGIWSSFIAVLELKVGTEWILVLEDDAVLVPRFRKQALKLIGRASPEVLSIRMGWNGCLNWPTGLSFPKYVYGLVLRLRRCFRERRADHSKGADRRSRPLYGAQANLIRRKSVSEFRQAIGKAEQALDVVLINLENSHPHQFVRSRRNLAWQWPDRSDIQSDFLERIGRNRALRESGLISQQVSDPICSAD